MSSETEKKREELGLPRLWIFKKKNKDKVKSNGFIESYNKFWLGLSIWWKMYERWEAKRKKKDFLKVSKLYLLNILS